MKRLKVVLWRFINATTFSRAKTPDGSLQHVRVTKVEGGNVTIDINHPLADVALNFDTKILSVWEATKEELDHDDGQNHKIVIGIE